MKTRKAAITGASSGIGLATAKLLCENGWMVYGLSRTAPKWNHKNFEFVECNVTSFDSVQKAAEKVGGGVDLLVANAGIALTAPLAELNPEDFEKQNAVNYNGVYYSIKAFINGMQEGSTIVAVASTAGHGPVPSRPAYSATKHAVRGLLKSIRSDCAARGIKASIVSPGGVNTLIREKRREDYLPAEEVAKTILFIAERPAGTVIDEIKLEPLVQAKAGTN
ncbi:MAG: SDR family oxidoreductase [Candidatus Micrarchaeia archaeon]